MGQVFKLPTFHTVPVVPGTHACIPSGQTTRLAYAHFRVNIAQKAARPTRSSNPSAEDGLTREHGLSCCRATQWYQSQEPSNCTFLEPSALEKGLKSTIFTPEATSDFNTSRDARCTFKVPYTGSGLCVCTTSMYFFM